MSVTPFHSIPKRQFLLRMLAPATLVFVLGIGVMGILADPEVFQPKPIRSASGLSGEAPGSLETATRGGITHWRMVYYFSTHMPEVCFADNAVNDFQKSQCGEFWTHYLYGLALSFLPLIIMIGFLKQAARGLRATYKHGQKRVREGKPILSGMVTDPAEAAHDIFSWWYCLQPLGVQLAKSGQIKVYIPRDAVVPRPGQTMAIFEPVQSFGENRHFAVLYAPHVAVISGGKR